MSDVTWEYAELSFRQLDASELTLTFTHSDGTISRRDDVRQTIAALGDAGWELVAPALVEGGMTTLWFKHARRGA